MNVESIPSNSVIAVLSVSKSSFTNCFHSFPAYGDELKHLLSFSISIIGFFHALIAAGIRVVSRRIARIGASTSSGFARLLRAGVTTLVIMLLQIAATLSASTRNLRMFGMTSEARYELTESMISVLVGDLAPSTSELVLVFIFSSMPKVERAAKGLASEQVSTRDDLHHGTGDSLPVPLAS